MIRLGESLGLRNARSHRLSNPEHCSSTRRLHHIKSHLIYCGVGGGWYSGSARDSLMRITPPALHFMKLRPVSACAETSSRCCVASLLEPGTWPLDPPPPHSLINQWFKIRNADHAPTDTPKLIRLIKCLKSDECYRSSGARHASNRSCAPVLPTGSGGVS